MKLPAILARVRRTAMLLLLSCCANVVAAAEEEGQWIIVPGERVGPIHGQTSEQDLESLFGSENVVRAAVSIGEGQSRDGTIVFPDDPEKKLEILWTDESRTQPTVIRLIGKSSIWKTAEGLSLGTTLKEIERLNGRPFRLMGFGWDGGGTFIDCNGGELTFLRCENPEHPRQSNRPWAVLNLLPASDDRRLASYSQVVGDQVFWSSNPAMQALNPRVFRLGIYLEKGGV